MQRWGVDYLYIGGGGLGLEGRRLEIADNDGSHALTLRGRVRASVIEGSLLRFSSAGLRADEEPQLCTTGDLTWSAERTVPPVAAVADPGSANRPVTRIVRQLGDGARLVLTRFS